MAANTEIIAKIRGETDDYKKSLDQSAAYTNLWKDLLNQAEMDVTQKAIQAGQERMSARRKFQAQEIEEFRKARNVELDIVKQNIQKENALYRSMQPGGPNAAGGGKNSGAPQGLTSIGYFVDDLQSGAGFRGIANNIQPLMQSLGASANAAAGVAIVAAEVNFLMGTIGKLYAAEWEGLDIAQRATKNWTAQEVATYKTAEAQRTAADIKEKVNAVTKEEIENSKKLEQQLKRNLAAVEATNKESARVQNIQRQGETIALENEDITTLERTKKQLDLKQRYREEDYKNGLENVKKKKEVIEGQSSAAAEEIRILTAQAEAEKRREAEARVNAKAVSSTEGDTGRSSARGFLTEAKDAQIKAAGMEARVVEIRKRKAEIDLQYEAVQAAEVEARNKLRTLDQEQANDAKKAGAEIDRIQKENASKVKKNLAEIATAATGAQKDVGNVAAEQTKKDTAKAKDQAAQRALFEAELKLAQLQESGRTRQAAALTRELRMKEEILKIEKMGYSAADAARLAKQVVDTEMGKQRGTRTSNPRNTTGINSVNFSGLDALAAQQKGNGPRGNLARTQPPGAMEDQVRANAAAHAKRNSPRNNPTGFDSFGTNTGAPTKASENAVVNAIQILTNVIKQGQNPSTPLKR